MSLWTHKRNGPFGSMTKQIFTFRKDFFMSKLHEKYYFAKLLHRTKPDQAANKPRLTLPPAYTAAQPQRPADSK